jgi:hypothetical protein
MKRKLVILFALACVTYAMSGCVTQTKTTTMPDGTVVVEKISAPSADALNAGVAGASILVPVLTDSRK